MASIKTEGPEQSFPHLQTRERFHAIGEVQFDLDNDALGDLYYRGPQGKLVRLAVPNDADNKYVGAQNGVPVWKTLPAGSGGGFALENATLQANVPIFNQADVDVLSLPLTAGMWMVFTQLSVFIDGQATTLTAWLADENGTIYGDGQMVVAYQDNSFGVMSINVPVAATGPTVLHLYVSVTIGAGFVVANVKNAVNAKTTQINALRIGNI